MQRRQREDERNLTNKDRQYNFKQTHGGRDNFPSGEWGSSSEFGQNSNYRESDSWDGGRERRSDRFRDRPYDMDNYYRSRQYASEMDFDQEEQDDEFSSREYNRSRFAEPYTGGQFSRSQYGLGSGYAKERSHSSSPGYGNRFNESSSGFTGKGPKGYRRSDEKIREEVCEILFHSPSVDASDIDVTVKEGLVILAGTVDSRYAKREAESCIENLSGIEDVQNELRIRNRPKDLNNESGIKESRQ